MNKRKLMFDYVFFLLKKKRFKKFFNLFWVYPLWLNFTWRGFLTNKFFPLLGIKIFPPFLEVEPTTVCPLRCKMCEHTYWREKSLNMSFSQFKKIVDQFRKLRWIGLTGIGESFSNPDFMKMVEYVSQKQKPIIELVDNFFLLDKNKAEKIIDLGVDIIFVSMCGATAKTCNRIMKNSSFEKVLKNIKDFVKTKKEKESQTPLLNFHYILTKDNMNEALSFLDLVNSLKVEVFEVLYTPLLHGFSQIKEQEINSKELEKLKTKIKNRAQKVGLNVAFNESAMMPKPLISTCANWLMPFVFASGEVVPCCTMNEANARAKQKALSMGNIFKKSFKDIWLGKKYQNFRKNIRKGKVPPFCVGCPIYKESS